MAIFPLTGSDLASLLKSIDLNVEGFTIIAPAISSNIVRPKTAVGIPRAADSIEIVEPHVKTNFASSSNS